MKINNSITPEIQSTQETAVPEMSQEQMMADLDQLMSKVQGKYQDFNTQKIQVGNNVQDMQEETMNKIFEILSAAGVDGSDPQQVNDFLEKLKGINPELYKIFEDAISSVMGGESGASPDTTMPNVSQMGGMEGVM